MEECCTAAAETPTAITPLKVFIRVRPCNGCGSCPVSCVSDDQIQLGHDKIFRFDGVFKPVSSQAEVYLVSIQPLVCKFLEGMNCTIFAYGQTGSGKTYTIGSGYYMGEEKDGMITRTLLDIFKFVEEGGSDGQQEGEVKHLLSVSYIEIYKEELRDLLQDDSYGVHKEILIREDNQGRTVISGVVEEEVHSVEDALGWLECGNAARVTSATEMNVRSSRSHAVFTVSMIQEKTEAFGGDHFVSSSLVSKFHFVDLAGSERVSRTRNKGERFKESVHINSGLLALGNVISALSDNKRKSAHIPYRDSKITRLLKDSLGGNALTVMITCLSPCMEDLPESLNTLKYAKRARNIKNHPVINRGNKGHTLLFSMREEIQSLKDELQRTREPGGINPPPPPSAVTAMTMDSSVMVELGDHKEYTTSLKRKLQDALIRLRVIVQSAEASHQQILSVGDLESQDLLREALEDVKDTLNDIITTGIGHEAEEDLLPVSRSTNTSLSDELEYKSQEKTKLEQALQTIQELRMEIEVLKEKVATADRSHSEHSALQAQYDELLGHNSDLERKVIELSQAQENLQNKVCSLKEEESLSKLKCNYNTENLIDDHHHRPEPVSRTVAPFLTTDTLYALVHGSITNIQDLDDSDCDEALRQLTELLSSRYQQASQAVLTGTATVGGPVPLVTSFAKEEIDRLSESMMVSQDQLNTAEKRLLNAQHHMKSLGLKIRFKEELIKELVKNNRAYQCLNTAYQSKIDSLEEEAGRLKLLIVQQKSSLRDVVVDAGGKAVTVTTSVPHPAGEATESVTSEQSTSASELSSGRSRRRKAKSAGLIKSKLEIQQKRLKETESKLLVLQRRRQETLRILQMGEKSDRKIAELEGDLERLRNQRGMLQGRLKEEIARKRNLEGSLEKYKLQIKSLSVCNEQQSRVIRVKTEEAALAQRKLRQTRLHIQPDKNNYYASNNNHLTSQKWFDEEIEKVIKEKQALEAFQKELNEREAIIMKQEALLQEKSVLEKKHAVSSHSRDVLVLSQQIESISESINTKEKLKESNSGQTLVDLDKEIRELKKKHSELVAARESCQSSSDANGGFYTEREIRLMELSEQIEVLETLVQMKSKSANQSLVFPLTQKNSISSKILALSVEEAKALLGCYIAKVIGLRQESEKQKHIEAQLRKRLTNKEQVVQGLEQSLDQSQTDKELRLTRLHKEHAQEIQVLLHQMETNEELLKQSVLTKKIKDLEKDLYYYKKTARDLKHQLKDLDKKKSMVTSRKRHSKTPPVLLKDSLELLS